jgi:oxaloacetate decarboxylase (Na+ extruding) subunit alpha
LTKIPGKDFVSLRKGLQNTKLQMLLRGQNIVGYRHYPDDVLEEFIKKAVANGIDIIRIFDALNDLRNMEKAIEYTKKAGAHAQGTLSYTISPLHNIDYFVRVALILKRWAPTQFALRIWPASLPPTMLMSWWDALKLK